MDLSGVDSPVKGPQMLRHTFVALFKTRSTNAAMSAQVARHDIDMNTRVYGRLGSAEVDAEYMKVMPNIPMPPPPAHLGTHALSRTGTCGQRHDVTYAHPRGAGRGGSSSTKARHLGVCCKSL